MRSPDGGPTIPILRRRFAAPFENNPKLISFAMQAWQGQSNRSDRLLTPPNRFLTPRQVRRLNFTKNLIILAAFAISAAPSGVRRRRLA
jgi:hypothetical protein